MITEKMTAKLSPFVEEFIPYNNYSNPSAYQEYMEWYRVTKSTKGGKANLSSVSFDRDSTQSTNMDEEGSLAESEEVDSVVESLFTQSSKGSGILKEGSAEERRLEQRQKQIDYGKNTIGYQRFTKAIPKQQRKFTDPHTPDKFSKCSKRAWDGLVRSWRRKLHQFDPPIADADENTPKRV